MKNPVLDNIKKIISLLMHHRCVQCLIAAGFGICVLLFVVLPTLLHVSRTPRKVCGVMNATMDGIVCNKTGVDLYHCGNHVYWKIDLNVTTDDDAPEALLCQVKGKDVLQCNHHLLYKIANV
jgi:hypothetical protein